MPAQAPAPPWPPGPTSPRSGPTEGTAPRQLSLLSAGGGAPALAAPLQALAVEPLGVGGVL